MDTAMHYLDELKDKYLHEVEKAFEDWDYQDFSPDKRTPLLENEVTNDIGEVDLEPEVNARQQVQGQGMNWAGLSRDEELADEDYASNVASNISLPYEARVVIMATPSSGIQGIPDTNTIQRFLQHANQSMNPQATIVALHTRLNERSWQTRAKALVLMELLLETPTLMPVYLPLCMNHTQLITQLNTIRCTDHNPIAREHARKVLSLIRSNGTNPSLVPRESPVHTRSAEKKMVGQSSIKPNLVVQTTTQVQKHSYRVASPTVAAAAMASWKRRSQRDLNSTSPRSSDLSSLKSMNQAPIRSGSINGRTSSVFY